MKENFSSYAAFILSLFFPKSEFWLLFSIFTLIIFPISLLYPSKITELKIEIGSHSVHLQNAFDKIQGSGQSLDQVHENEYAEYTFEQLEADLDSVRAKISRLGAINLAAPDEIDAETKRKEEAGSRG